MTLLPDSIMGNRDLMQALAEFSEPLVRITDKLVGATNAMRLEAVAKDGRKVVLKYAHEDLEVCVGIATAAFAVATLKGDVRKLVQNFAEIMCVVPPPPLCARGRALLICKNNVCLWGGGVVLHALTVRLLTMHLPEGGAVGGRHFS